VRNYHDAEDAAQDCFLRAFSHLLQFRGEAEFSTWLNSIARNCSLMLLRRRRNRPEVKIEDWPDSNGNLALFNPPDETRTAVQRSVFGQ
jgi:RNA polymerase sigma-70 factor (ECF subfamily)